MIIDIGGIEGIGSVEQIDTSNEKSNREITIGVYLTPDVMGVITQNQTRQGDTTFPAE